MSFKNRKIIRSSKNYQLSSSLEGEVNFQFGRSGQDSFIFDFRYPFSPVQAFAAAIASIYKKFTD
ncbi:MAG: tubby family protein [archaeon]|nr:tubby family protein [archaeon]